MALSMEVGLGPGDTVLDGDPAPIPIFGPCLLWPNVWMDTEVGLGPGNIVLDGDPAASHFSAHALWPNGWMDQDAT